MVVILEYRGGRSWRAHAPVAGLPCPPSVSDDKVNDFFSDYRRFSRFFSCERYNCPFPVISVPMTSPTPVPLSCHNIIPAMMVSGWHFDSTFLSAFLPVFMSIDRTLHAGHSGRKSPSGGKRYCFSTRCRIYGPVIRSPLTVKGYLCAPQRLSSRLLNATFMPPKGYLLDCVKLPLSLLVWHKCLSASGLPRNQNTGVFPCLGSSAQIFFILARHGLITL